MSPPEPPAVLVLAPTTPHAAAQRPWVPLGDCLDALAELLADAESPAKDAAAGNSNKPDSQGV
jgi:hypothetical protein